MAIVSLALIPRASSLADAKIMMCVIQLTEHVHLDVQTAHQLTEMYNGEETAAGLAMLLTTKRQTRQVGC